MSAVNQKEYLKRYFSKDKAKKKHKKKALKGIIQNRVKIIDDNIDVQDQIQTIQDIENDNEDAPQVVAVIDDRPVELRNSFKDSSNWTAIDIKPEIKEEPQSPERERKLRDNYSDEESPPRKSRIRDNNRDESPPRRRANVDDYSSERKSRIRDNNRDESPPRRRAHAEDDYSSKRKSRIRDNNRDESPPRRRAQVDDYSPERKQRSRNSSDKGNFKRNDVDESPPRNRRRKREDTYKNDDYSPPRRSRQPSRPPRRSSDDNSPPRKLQHKESSPRRRSRWATKSLSPQPSTSKSSKATKTLDGKTAGLQNAKDLYKETQKLKDREAKQFKEIPTEISGANAVTVMRDRKTGRIRDLEAEAHEKLAQNDKAKELQKQYDQWGKGIKQTEEYKQKLEDAAYEMSKPLARYADDEDLERHLKEQERAGDPMLAYLKKKKKNEAVKAGVKLKPEYMGEFMPNRYGIRPGHRWDGVDRSNGYEKKWFDAINKRNADREEAYKWNSEDM